MSNKYLPKEVSWFRLPEYIKSLLIRVGVLETQVPVITGATDTFTTTDGKTVEVVNGIVTEIYETA